MYVAGLASKLKTIVQLQLAAGACVNFIHCQYTISYLPYSIFTLLPMTSVP